MFLIISNRRILKYIKMKFVLSSTILASVMAPAVSFSYLDTLGGANPVAAPPAAAAPSNGSSYLDSMAAPAPAAPAPAAAAPSDPYVSGFADVELSATSAGYLDSMNLGEEIGGPGMMTHVDTLNTGSGRVGGAGIQSYAGAISATSSLSGGAGIQSYAGTLSPSSFDGTSFSPYGEPSASFSGATSTDGVSFTLETGDISGLVDGLGPGGTLRLTGSIDNVSYN